MPALLEESVKLRLRDVRKAKLMSQRELAAKSRVAVTTIVRLEAGIGDPNFVTIRKLATALGVEPADLVIPDPS